MKSLEESSMYWLFYTFILKKLDSDQFLKELQWHCYIGIFRAEKCESQVAQLENTWAFLVKI
jgi:hypothetical protein